MYYWKCIKGISLSSIALYGIDSSSKLVAPVDIIWLKAIEIIPVTIESKESLVNIKEASQCNF